MIVKSTRPRADKIEEDARQIHRGAFEALDGLGVDRADVAAIAVFRTQHPTAITERLLEVAAHLTGENTPRFARAAWMDAPPRRG